MTILLQYKNWKKNQISKGIFISMCLKFKNVLITFYWIIPTTLTFWGYAEILWNSLSGQNWTKFDLNSADIRSEFGSNSITGSFFGLNSGGSLDRFRIEFFKHFPCRIRFDFNPKFNRVLPEFYPNQVDCSPKFQSNSSQILIHFQNFKLSGCECFEYPQLHVWSMNWLHLNY